MFRLDWRKRASLLALVLLAQQAVAQAAPASKEMVDGYQKMCLDSVNYPKPIGEWDLKGNSKLATYCGCFSKRFAERAMNFAKWTENNPGKRPPSLEQSNKEELDLRNSCRQQVGLPAAAAVTPI